MSLPPTIKRIAESGASRLHYRIDGNSSALPDIVLEHGGGGSADDWRNLVPLLAAHTRVFSYDRAGMGDSPSDGLGCGAPAVTARLEKLVQQMGVRKPFIHVGYSLGGLYGRHYAQLHPQDVAGLVLVDTTPTALVIPQALIDRTMRLLWLLHWVARSGLGNLLGGWKGDKERFKRSLRQIAAPGWVQRMREETGAIAAIQAEVARVAPKLQHPTLAVIAGASRKGMPPEEFTRVLGLHAELAAAAPAGSRFFKVEGANHGTLVGDPQYAAQLAEHTLDFARGLAGVRA